MQQAEIVQPQMSEEEYLEMLGKYPCPACGAVGHLKPHAFSIKAEHKGQQVVVEGEGTKCDACQTPHMNEAMTESMLNQIERIESGTHSVYVEADTTTGDLVRHPVH